jgi:hypothetical protein
MAVEYVVAEHQGHGVRADVLAADELLLVCGVVMIRI